MSGFLFGGPKRPYNGNNNVEIEHYKIVNGWYDWPGTLVNMYINANLII